MHAPKGRADTYVHILHDQMQAHYNSVDHNMIDNFGVNWALSMSLYMTEVYRAAKKLVEFPTSVASQEKALGCRCETGKESKPLVKFTPAAKGLFLTPCKNFSCLSRLTVALCGHFMFLCKVL